MITIAYMTGRKDPKIQWFFDSLSAQVNSPEEVSIIVVDFWSQPQPDKDWTEADVTKRHAEFRALCTLPNLRSVPVKPTVWQGPTRLTKDHWWAASAARNTALCLAPDGWLAYVDDLSVLMPGWLQSVREAIAGNYVVFGAYKKVNKLVVESGAVRNHEEHSKDSRLPMSSGGPVSCAGSCLFGCSLAGPVESFLSVNGWPEIADGLGMEDVTMGCLLGNTNQWAFRYDPRMMTLESEEHHGHRHSDMVFRHEDYGVSPHDKSHRLLDICRGSHYLPGYFPEGGIRKIREDVLSGNPFPIPQIPEHCWFTGTPLRDLK